MIINGTYLCSAIIIACCTYFSGEKTERAGWGDGEQQFSENKANLFIYASEGLLPHKIEIGALGKKKFKTNMQDNFYACKNGQQDYFLLLCKREWWYQGYT